MILRLVGEYSTKSFQNKLGDMLQKEAQQGEVCDESPCRWTLAEECHADIFARYGFKSGTGVERLRPIVLIFQKFPDLADKVQKLWKLLGLKSSPAEFFIDDKPQEVSQELPVPQTEKRILSKARALAFQAELLGAFSAPAFQKKLAEMSRKHFTHLQDPDSRAARPASIHYCFWLRLCKCKESVGLTGVDSRRQSWTQSWRRPNSRSCLCDPRVRTVSAGYK